MELNYIKNELIMHKNYSNLKGELVSEIQNTLLTKIKESDFAVLLKKIEIELNNNQFSKK